jgi:hypothetical protein
MHTAPCEPPCTWDRFLQRSNREPRIRRHTTPPQHRLATDRRAQVGDACRVRQRSPRLLPFQAARSKSFGQIFLFVRPESATHHDDHQRTGSQTDQREAWSHVPPLRVSLCVPLCRVLREIVRRPVSFLCFSLLFGEATASGSQRKERSGTKGQQQPGRGSRGQGQQGRGVKRGWGMIRCSGNGNGCCPGGGGSLCTRPAGDLP